MCELGVIVFVVKFVMLEVLLFIFKEYGLYVWIGVYGGVMWCVVGDC